MPLFIWLTTGGWQVRDLLQMTIETQKEELDRLQTESQTKSHRLAMSEVNLDAALEDAEALVHELNRTRESENAAHEAKVLLESEKAQLLEEKMAITLEKANMERELEKMMGWSACCCRGAGTPRTC